MPYKLNPITGQFDYYEKAETPTDIYAKAPSRNFFIDGAYDGQNYDPGAWGSVNRLFAYPISIKQDCEFIDLQIWSLSAAGNSVFGIYENYQGLPGSLVAQTSEFDNSILGTKVSTFTTPCKIKAGFYWVAWLTSSTPSLGMLGYQSLGINLAPTGGLAPVNRVSRALTYTNTLPSSFGTPDLFQAIYPSIPAISFSITY